jgi:hypothetical protein
MSCASLGARVGASPASRASAGPSAPIDASIPGARSVKVVFDTADGQYFQNSVLYEVHYDFASTYLSGNGLPVVPALGEFNSIEHYQPDRRFILGAVSYFDFMERNGLFDRLRALLADASFRTRKLRNLGTPD